MNGGVYQVLSLDFPPLVTALASSLACALLGNFLLLRRMSLMGDAISHAVLPGIVLAFLLSGSRSTLPVLLGAMLIGVLTTVLVEMVSKLGAVERGAAMGVVFAVLFALGVLLLEQAAARHVDLDADCLLHGQMESIFWYPPQNWSEIWRWSTLTQLPAPLIGSVIILLVVIGAIALLYKEFALSAFDPALSNALGFSSNFLHYLLMILVAAAVVGSFAAVGSILVIAMLICPAATARLWTDRLSVQIVVSGAIAVLGVISGYFLSAFAPTYFGFAHSLNAAGGIASVLGFLLIATIVVAPHYGLLGKLVRGFLVQVQVAGEDLLATLYRMEEQTLLAREEKVKLWARAREGGSALAQWFALRRLLKSGLVIESMPDAESRLLRLSEAGSERARALVRTHRLWESYLVDKVGLRSDHVHPRATQLEHFTDAQLRERLAGKKESGELDPHGVKIP